MTRAALVAAHPDDEILWLSPAVAAADPLVLCFGAPFANPARAASRARAVAALGLPRLVNLNLPESGARPHVDWTAPHLTPFGIGITDLAARARYEANFHSLVERLRPLLQGVEAVYTHNPWGEYGHPEHIQVHRAVAALQAELGFTLWFSGYVAPLSLGLARQLEAEPLWREKRVAAPDVRLARRLRGVYLRHRAWTWSPFHIWPAWETLYAQPPGPRAGWRGLRGETLLDATRLRWWVAPAKAKCLL
jgi:LmbE family N-acetylglucosaminyl deacetylase